MLTGDGCADAIEIDVEFLLRIAGEKLARNQLEVRFAGLRRSEGPYSVFDVVALGEEPAITSGQRREVEDEIVGSVAGGERRWECGVGDGGFKSEAALIPVLCERRDGLFAVTGN